MRDQAQGSLTVVTGPQVEPLTVEELHGHLRIFQDTEDGLLEEFIASVRRHVEDIAGIACITQTLEWALDSFPAYWGYQVPWGYPVTAERFGGIEVPRPPLASVTSITYVDAAGATQTLSPTLYQVDTRSIPGRIVPAYGKTWPSTRWQPNAVIVKYVAGSSLTDLQLLRPEIIEVLKVAAGMLYQFRAELLDGNAPQATGILRRLLNPHRVWITA